MRLGVMQLASQKCEPGNERARSVSLGMRLGVMQ